MQNIKQLQSITTTINQPLRINYIHNINQFINQHIHLKNQDRIMSTSLPNKKYTRCVKH